MAIVGFYSRVYKKSYNMIQLCFYPQSMKLGVMARQKKLLLVLCRFAGGRTHCTRLPQRQEPTTTLDRICAVVFFGSVLRRVGPLIDPEPYSRRKKKGLQKNARGSNPDMLHFVLSAANDSILSTTRFMGCLRSSTEG